MVEHPVQHHPEVAAVTTFQQSVEGGVVAQQRIDLEVVVSVVAMAGGRGEDRVQVDGVDTQVGEPVEAVGDSCKVTSLVSVKARRRVPRFQTRRLRRPSRTGEPVGEDLIEDGVLDPRR